MRRDDRIDIQQEMTFTETFSNTIVFLRENAGALLKAILLIAGPFILLGAIALGFFFPGYFSLTGAVDPGPFTDGTFVETMAGKNTLRLVFFLLSTSLISSVTFCYMHLYTQIQDRDITVGDVWDLFRKNILRIFAAKIFKWIIVAVAINCTLFPGLIVFSLIGGTELLILEKRMGPFKAIGESWKLMKNYWGVTFFMMILMFLMILLFWGLFETPTLVLDSVKEFTTVSEDSSTQKISDAIHAIAQVLLFILYLLPTTALGLRYYSVKEEHYREGIIRRIRTMGRALEDEDIYKEDEQF